MKIENYSLKLKRKVLLDSTDLKFEDGKINHLLGKNGVGKSQLAKDFILNRSGAIPKMYCNNNIIISSFSSIPKELRIKDLRKCLDGKLNGNVEQILQIDKIDPKLKIGNLSDGQKQKVKLYIFLSQDKNLIILDEVTNAIDKKTTSEIYDFLNLFMLDNFQKTIINITHNISDLNNMPGNYFIFDEKKVQQVANREEAIKWYVEG